jgi:hypothetical protein
LLRTWCFSPYGIKRKTPFPAGKGVLPKVS